MDHWTYLGTDRNHFSEISMKQACVLGMGASGKAAAHFLQQRGFVVTCVDDDPTIGCLATQKLKMEEFDLFVPAPGVPRTHSLYLAAKKAGVEIAGEMELALRELKGHRCIAVTGTNGKTTVVKWMEALLNGAGIAARALGNVGEVLLDYLSYEKEGEVLIIEVSSYQLETLHQRVFDLGFILNITEDHLSRYDSFDEYAKVKCHLEKCMRGFLHVYSQVARQFGHHLHRPYEIYEIDSVVKTGRWTAAHDLENATAVWRLAQFFGISAENFCRALDSFEKPAHRIEYVTEINGVAYYNDSKATNVDAVLKALSAMNGPVILLAGGVDKGGSFAPLLVFKERISRILAFGQCRDKIAKELGALIPVEICGHMQEATERAHLLAKRGENVLLSPGCSSFDSFKNYAHRGDEFKKIVQTHS